MARNAFDGPKQLTIEQLAAESGMSVRNIRAHQARGLLAPPEVRMRVGYYGPEHVAQLRLIRELQDEGFNLSGIKRLIEEADGAAEPTLALQAGPAGSGRDRAGGDADDRGARPALSGLERGAPAVLAQAERLGALLPVGEGRFEVPSPSLLALAEDAVRHGVSVAQCAGVARGDRAALRLDLAVVREAVPDGGVEAVPAGRHARGDVARVEEAVERLRPIASEALMAIFQQRLSAQIDAASRRLLDGGEA